MTTLQLASAHRPQRFDELVGQTTAKAIITAGITNDRLGPVLLFSGQRGTGKTTTARLIAKSLNCRNRNPSTAEPCGKCNSCQRFAEPDPQWSSYLEIDAGRAGGVDSIRDLADLLDEPVIEGNCRMVVIDEAHGLTGQAATASLKLLEEPPAGTIIALLTTHPQKLLPTIKSRCQEVRFMALSAEEVSAALKKAGSEVSEETIDHIASAVDGDLRRAFNLLQSAQAGVAPEKLLFGEGGADVLAADLLLQIATAETPSAIDRVKLLVGNGKDAIGAQRAVAEISNQLWALTVLHSNNKTTAAQLGVSARAHQTLKELLSITDAAQVQRWVAQITESWSMVSTGLIRPEAAVGIAAFQLMQASKPPARQVAPAPTPSPQPTAATPQPVADTDGDDRWQSIATEMETSLVAKLEKCERIFNGDALQIRGSGLVIKRLEGSLSSLEQQLAAFGINNVSLVKR